MATQVQIRRGTSSQVAAFTGAEGEIVVNTTNDSVHVNDGSTAGGFELARVDGSNWAITNDITTTSNIDVGTVTADGLTVDGDINLASGGRARGAAGGDFQVSSGLTNDASEPTYTFRGDPDTGIFYGGANTVGITTGGKQRINIASNGDVSLYEDTGTTPKMVWDSSAERLGIGTSSPSTKLHLGGTAPGDSIIRQDSTASGTNWEIGERSAGKWQIFEDDSDSIVATFMSTGSVGIGTSSPDTLLELVGADPILTIRDSSTSSSVGNATLRLAETGASDTLDQYFDIKATAGQLQIIDNWNEGGGTGTRVVIDDSGNLLVGKTSTSASETGHRFGQSGTYVAVTNFTGTNEQAIFNQDASTGTTQIDFRNENVARGFIEWTNTATTYNTTSDRRMKENIQDADDAGSNIDAIQVRKFDWIESGEHHPYGTIAQELQSIASYAVTGSEDSEKMMAVDYSTLVPMLIKEIQSLRARVQQLENN
jgi:hypothetical protein